MGKIFVVRPSTTKTPNILPHKNYPLYGIIILILPCSHYILMTVNPLQLLTHSVKALSQAYERISTGEKKICNSHKRVHEGTYYYKIAQIEQFQHDHYCIHVCKNPVCNPVYDVLL